ncbi:MAG: competence/damage-inducible protein A [Clostridia bacterium]|nr:competence/damage-inducible protein A [Clostridia bacterium]
MKCTIMSVGTEILFGSIVNTNTVYLSQQMNELGIDVMYHITVGDNPARLKNMIHHAFLDCDFVITTGGLGPTQDDLTKEVIAEAFGENIITFPEQLEILKRHFEKYGRPMTQNNLKQANFPENAIIFPNPNGTAPGFALEKQNKLIISMPGPPKEMLSMFENEVKPFLEKRSEGTIYYKVIRTFNLGESALETKLLDLIDGQSDPTLATYAKDHESTLRIASKRKTKSEAKEAVEQMLHSVRERIGEYIYSEDDEDLAAVVLNKLMKNNIRLSAAESCTGGFFSKTVTDMPGISAIFDRGIVTYSNQSKVEELGVKQESLDRFGAVSEEVALEMANGLYKITKSDVCISVTGVAGPDGGSPGKPVGLIFVGLCYKGKLSCHRYQMRNSMRQHIRSNAVMHMFLTIYEAIKASY